MLMAIRQLSIITIFIAIVSLALILFLNQKQIQVMYVRPKANNSEHIHEYASDSKQIYLAVTTTKKFHKDRMALMMKTWIPFVQEQVFVFTDTDEPIKNFADSHVINTKCPLGHGDSALSCKMGIEFDYFITSNKRWFCHLDDDTYVNVNKFLQLLDRYNSSENWYIGKNSIHHTFKLRKIAFWFGTGGAGFCISRNLAEKMIPHAARGRFRTVSKGMGIADDVTIGYIINHILKVNFTIIETMHSHYETLSNITKPQGQITLSYKRNAKINNVIVVHGFNETYDPTRILSIHCLLYPNENYCRQLLI